MFIKSYNIVKNIYIKSKKERIENKRKEKMIWIILAFATAIFNSAAMIAQKKVLLEEHAMEFSAVFSLINLILSLPLIYFIDFSKLTFNLIAIIFLIAWISSVAFLLIAKSVRHMEVSFVAPLLVIEPGITSIVAFFSLNEVLSLWQIGGISLLILGSYVLELEKKSRIFDPLKKLIKLRYAKYILIAILMYSITAVAERYILVAYDLQVSAYIFLVHIFLALHFMIMLSTFHDGIKGIKNGFKKAGLPILLVSFFTVIHRFTQIAAFKLAYVGIVLAIKRTSSLLTVIIGGELFHEKNIMRKSIATAIMIIGAVLIVF